jgi:purine-binding chemotaxis protein CheW
MESLPPQPSDDEALLHELSDLLGDLPDAPEEAMSVQLVTDASEMSGPDLDAPREPTLHAPGDVADEQLPTLAQMVRSLNERISRALVAPTLQSDTAAAHRYLTFSAGARRYGVPLRNVIEIGMVLPVAPLPRVPEWLVGLANLRGHVIPVLDLGLLLDAGAPRMGGPGRLIVVRPADGEAFGGVIVDAVHRIRSFPPDSVRRPETDGGGVSQMYLAGLGEDDGEPVALLDMTRLLQSDMLQQFAA